MKKRKVVYRFGEFTDFAGNVRKFVVAALSELLPDGEEVFTPNRHYTTDTQFGVVQVSGDGNVEIHDTVLKRVSLGFAVCSPEDEYNEELGKTIALGKAEKRPVGVMYATKTGMINTSLVDALLDQEVEYFKNNPGAVLAGYNKAKEAYLAKNNG